MHRTLTALVATTIASAGLTGAGVPAASAGELVKLRLNQAIDKLPVASETRQGYEREKFVHWVDGDGDCQDTRDEVLAAESLVKVTGCDIQRGKWRSYYDGAATRSSTGFDIGHLVPLAEAWDSGAKRWNAPTRQRFANDLRDSRSLVAVTASSNRSKSDRDPAEWMPALGKCAALLHDSAEDQGGERTLERIADELGTRVSKLVRECSDAVPEPGAEKPPWRERKQQMVDSLPSLSHGARLVIAADKLHNTRSTILDV